MVGMSVSDVKCVRSALVVICAVLCLASYIQETELHVLPAERRSVWAPRVMPARLTGHVAVVSVIILKLKTLLSTNSFEMHTWKQNVY